MSETLGAAIAAAEANPSDALLWDEVEEIAGREQLPEPVTVSLGRVLATAEEPSLIVTLAQRAVRFHDEWDEDAGSLLPVLARVVSIDPSAQWAIDRLSLVLTRAGRWDELLSLYDRLLDSKDLEASRRATILEEAAQIAKDFSTEPGRAIKYMQALVPLRPKDSQLATSLERLLEKQGRFEELVSLWRTRLPQLTKDAQLTSRARVATTLLDSLSRPADALIEIRALGKDDYPDPHVCVLLDKVVTHFAAEDATRREALWLLRDRHAAGHRQNEVLRVLAAILPLSTATERLALHREMAERALAEGLDEEGARQLSALFELDPTDEDARGQLRALAERTGSFAPYADAMALGARVTKDQSRRLTLLSDAGSVQSEILANPVAAIGLLSEALDLTDVTVPERRNVARKLKPLLEQANRSAQLVNVLETLSELEEDEELKRACLADAAKVATELNELDRALVAWNGCLALSAYDPEALDAKIGLLTQLDRPRELAGALQLRAERSRDDVQVRMDRMTIAELLERLDDVPSAIDAWRNVLETDRRDRPPATPREPGQPAKQTESPLDDSALHALSRLLRRAERWVELASLYAESAIDGRREAVSRAKLHALRGEVQEVELTDALSAVGSYIRGLEEYPGEPLAQRRLLGLVDQEPLRAQIVAGLATAYAQTDAFEDTLAILPHRIRAESSDAGRARLLLEAAQLEERRRGDVLAAARHFCRAFPLVPLDTVVEAEMVRLAEVSAAFEILANAYDDAIDRLGTLDDEVRVPRELQLRRTAAELHRDRMADPLAALARARDILALVPEDADAAHFVAQLAAQAGDVNVLALAIVSGAAAAKSLDPRAAEVLTHVGVALLDRLVGAIDKQATLLEPGVVLRDVLRLLAVVHETQRMDPASAEATLVRAVDAEPANEETYALLANLQRKSSERSAALLQTLLRWAEVASDRLLVLSDAADVALNLLGDRKEAIGLLERLLGLAKEQMADSSPGASSKSGLLARDALVRLVAIHVDAGDLSLASAAIEAALSLAWDDELAFSLRHESAELWVRAGDPARAVSMLQVILAERPTDARAIARLSDLFRELGDTGNLIALRRHQLSLDLPLDQRLEVRLDLARLLSQDDPKGQREALDQNLAEAPAHVASVLALEEALLTQGAHEALATVFLAQAEAAESRDLPRSGEFTQLASSELFVKLASLREEHLQDVPGAIAALRRAAALDLQLPTLDALIRLHIGRREHDDAVAWLVRRLDRSSPQDRPETSARLSEQHLAAGREVAAREVLESALAEDPTSTLLRDHLARRYREGNDLRGLATLFEDGAELAKAPQKRLEYLREAAEVRRLLGDSIGAVGMLQQAVMLAPQDRMLRTVLAETLRTSGQIDDAERLLNSLVEEYGRRRPAERAAVHAQLAEIAHVRGALNAALEQLELASSMDVASTTILYRLGRVAEEAGQTSRAETGLRALLLLLRRRSEPAGPTEPVQSEVLFHLHRIAVAQGQVDRAEEMLESAFEAATHNDVEARGLDRAVAESGDFALQLRVYESRLARVSGHDEEVRLLAAMAEIQEGPLSQPVDALRNRLRTLTLRPLDPRLHDRALSLADRLQTRKQYIDHVRELFAETERAHDDGAIAMLGERLGRALVAEGEGKAAAVILGKVLATGRATIEALTTLERAANASGDFDLQAEALRRILESTSADEDPERRSDDLYRLAELELRRDPSRTEALVAMEQAFERDPRPNQAAAALARAATTLMEMSERTVMADLRTDLDVQEASVRGVLALFERVARVSDDKKVLLDALTRLSMLPGANLDVLREAFDIAVELADPVEGDLLDRAVDLARRGDGAAGIWAYVALGKRKKERGEYARAIGLLREASEVADPQEAEAFLLEAAEIANVSLKDLELAAKLYESLRQRDLAARAAWEPLLGIYRKIGDQVRLESLIADTIDAVSDPQERATLRMERARILLDDPSRVADAIVTLRELLDDEPGHNETAMLLLDVLERSQSSGVSSVDDLETLLGQRIDYARGANDIEQLVTLTLRLGARFQADRLDDARALYRDGLASAPRDARLLRALLSIVRVEDDAAERANLLEQLLDTQPDGAVDLVLELASVRRVVEDDEGYVRALERGSQIAPTDARFRDALEAHYTEMLAWDRLVDLVERDAQAEADVARSASRFRQAALLAREQLADPNRALALLRYARQKAPEDRVLFAELVEAQIGAGEFAGALEDIGIALSGAISKTEKILWLGRRADIHYALRDEVSALADLERAFTEGGASQAGKLLAGLERRRQSARINARLDDEREATLRLAEVAEKAGDRAVARDVLRDWATHQPTDVEALRALLRVEVADQHSDPANGEGVVDACERLLQVEQGDDLAKVVMRLADACTRIGQPARARPALEHVFNLMPADGEIRKALRGIYEASGAFRELGELTLADASAAKDDASRFDSCYQAGAIFMQVEGGLPRAIEAFIAALKIRPAQLETTVALSDCYAATGDIMRSSELLTAAIAGQKGKRTRELSQLQHAMARAAAAAGDQEAELEWLQAALDSDMQNGAVGGALAELALSLGHLDVALKALKAVTLLRTPGPMSRALATLRQGQIAERQGDPKRAVFLAKQSLRDDPNLAEAVELLQRHGATLR